MIVTFYSYKGGVGRSMAVANVAELLAIQGYDVIVCDWDLEAPGLEAYLFSSPNEAVESASWPGIMDLIEEYKEMLSTPISAHDSQPEVSDNGNFTTVGDIRLRQPSTFAKLIPGHSLSRGSIRYLSAGCRDKNHASHYADLVQEFSWADFYTSWAGGSYLEFFRDDLCRSADVILIDSRTGLTEHGGVCTHHLADLVILMTASNQLNLSGTLSMARGLLAEDLREVRNGRRIEVIPIAARVEQTAESRELASFRTRMVRMFTEYLPTEIGDAKAFFHDTEIPYVPFYSFQERVVAREDEDVRSRDLYEAYDNLVQSIRRWGIKKGFLTGEAANAFISYSHADSVLAKRLIKHLKPLEKSGVLRILWEQQLKLGASWEKEIEDQLEKANLFILLITPDYLASEFLYDYQMRKILERHEAGEATVLPVVLRPCAWMGSPLARLQVFPPGGRSVIEYQGEKVFVELADIVRQIAQAPETSKYTRRIETQGLLPNIWNLPPRNVHFTGRDDLMLQLHHGFVIERRKATIQSITGMGGIGKTELAIEYAYRFKDDYWGVWWIRATNPQSIAEAYCELAGVINLPEKEVTDINIVVSSVRNWLEGNIGWLLIFDDAQDSKDIEPFLPSGSTGHVLITSRNPSWGRLARSLDVDVWQRQVSMQFLMDRSGDSDRDAANQVADALGDLPLALEQAAAFVEKRQQTLAAYVKLLEKGRRADLMRSSVDLEKTVTSTFELIFEHLENESPSGADLLKLCAFFAPDNIPLDAIRDGAEYVSDPLKRAIADDLEFDDTVGSLLRYSLAQRDMDRLSIHQIVQVVTRDRLSEKVLKRWAKSAVALINKALPEFPYDAFNADIAKVYDRLLSHALAAANNASSSGCADEKTARLFNQAGVYGLMRADFTGATEAFEKATAIFEEVLGPERPDVATSLNNLAELYVAQGRYAEAEPLYRRALAIDEQVYGPDHPTVATRANNIGLTLQAQGDLEGALTYAKRALAIDEQVYGPEHPAVARDASNIGQILQAQGDLEGALTYAKRALAIDEQVYGLDHPTVATRANNIGLTLQAQGDLEGALTYAKRALAIDEQVYGPEHPAVARDASNIGQTLQAQGDLDGAFTYAKRALAIDEQVYEPDHPTVARDASNIGQILQDQGDLEGALTYTQQALKIFEDTLGSEHPNTQIVADNLAGIEVSLQK